MSERGIIDDRTMRLRQVVCPAGEEIASVREAPLPNTPGVLCRISWDVQRPDTNPRVLVRYCCHAEGALAGREDGYVGCPVWRFDRERVWKGRKSFGDQDEQRSQDERTWRDDLTGSEYGDTSWMDPIDEAVDEAIDVMKERGGGVIGGSATAGE